MIISQIRNISGPVLAHVCCINCWNHLVQDYMLNGYCISTGGGAWRFACVGGPELCMCAVWEMMGCASFEPMKATRVLSWGNDPLLTFIMSTVLLIDTLLPLQTNHAESIEWKIILIFDKANNKRFFHLVGLMEGGGNQWDLIVFTQGQRAALPSYYPSLIMKIKPSGGILR